MCFDSTHPQLSMHNRQSSSIGFTVRGTELTSCHELPQMEWENCGVAVSHCLLALCVPYRMCPWNLWLWVSAAM